MVYFRLTYKLESGPLAPAVRGARAKYLLYPQGICAAFPVRRRGPRAPNGNHQDHGTKGPCSESRDLPARFRRPDLRPRPPFASGVRVPFAILSCQASETTCDRSFPAMVFL